MRRKSSSLLSVVNDRLAKAGFTRRFFIFTLFATLLGCGVSIAQPNWGVGVNAGIPFLVGDMTSFSSEKTYVGFTTGMQLDRRFTPWWNVSLTADYGQARIGSAEYSDKFFLDRQGVGWYEPPRLDNVDLYRDLYGEVRYASLGAHLNLNVCHLFTRDQAWNNWTILASPAIYGQYFWPRIYSKRDDRRFRDSSGGGLSLGLGGSLSVRYALSKGVALQLRSSASWISNKQFDGIDACDKQRANLLWSNTIGIIFNLN